MPGVVRMWSVWICFTAGLLCPAHDARSQTSTPGT